MARNVVVTGGSGGLGSELVSSFGGSGDEVWSISRRRPPAENDVPTARFTAADLSDPHALRAAAESILETWPEIHVLVNNAGSAVFADFADTTDEDLERQLAVNLQAPFRLTRLLLPALERASGCVVNITSSSAVRPVWGRPAAAYAMAKGGLEALTRALAQELSPRGVRVNAVAPGTLRTPMTEAVLDASDPEAVAARFPMKRIGAPSDVVGAVRYLSSEEAAWVTGAVLRVDGGFTIA